MRDAGGRIDGRLSYRCGDTSRPLLEETIGDALRAAAAEVPDRRAIVEGSPGPGPRRTLSYAELLGQAERVAWALLARFRPGEHVAVWSGNSLDWILLEYGAALAGLVLVTVNPAYQASELTFVVRQSRSVGLFHVAQPGAAARTRATAPPPRHWPPRSVVAAVGAQRRRAQLRRTRVPARPCGSGRPPARPTRSAGTHPPR